MSWKKLLPELQELESANARFSYQIRERRLLYRLMDWYGQKLRLRHVPQECGIEDCEGYAPLPCTVEDEGGSSNGVWNTTFNQAMELVRHDDALNWQKFHYLLAVFLGIVSGAAYLLSHDGTTAAGFLGLFGLLMAWMADLTFQEGLRCLRSHRRRVVALERRLGSEEMFVFIFRAAPFNQRDALELGPALMALVCLGLTIYAFFGWIPVSK